jgi:hypothetical protein
LRAVSLSTDPTFSLLKDNFICGFKDISRKGYAGASGKHEPDENAVDTTNGAGPHNIQMFVLTPDGTVLHCLPGYWHSGDLASELKFAEKLNAVWKDPFMTEEEKSARFKELNLRQISLEPSGMSQRSHMQGFDLQYEAKNRPHSDFFKDPKLVQQKTGKGQKMAKGDDNVQTVDIVMHERMAARPFIAYKKFDTANFCCYGKDEYDKHEQFRNADGSIKPGADLSKEPMIGNDPRAHPIETQVKKQGLNALRMGIQSALR